VSDLLAGVRIVLVQPLHPGNVGATVRAMANTGLSDLVVVDPPAFDMERARWMAPGCDERWAAVRFVSTLDEALEGAYRAVATTARHRRWHQPVLEPGALAADILAAPPDQITAVLFGREDFGLPREAVARCDRLVRIPTPEHASLNLAQAVLIVAWCLFDEARQHGLRAQGRLIGGHEQRPTAARQKSKGRRDHPADLPTTEPAVTEWVDLLDRVGYTRGTSPDKIAVTWRSILQRASASIREVEAFRGAIRRIEWALEHPGIDWKKGKKANQTDEV